jgi:putative hydrolase of the HAD superfamily
MTLRACLIDALGTTVRLLPPWERLDPELVAGIEPERVRAAFTAEMTHYAAHAHEARDAASLAELRRVCAGILGRGLGREVSVEAMMAAISFEAFDDAAPALTALREAGLTLVCVSNWDYELDRVLERVGLAGRFDGVVVSAVAGTRKPDPAIFARALEVAGCDAAEAVHVGDSDDDAAGAEAAGIGFLRIDREGGGGDLASLAELPAKLAEFGMGQHPPP